MTGVSAGTPGWPREGYHEEWLALEDALGGRYILSSDISESKEVFNNTFAKISKTWPSLEAPLTVWDDNTGLEYGNMSVRFYKPKSEAPLPLVVHFPGGRFVTGNLETEDYQARYMAVKTSSLVISVEYPKAPKFKLDQIIQYGVLAVQWCRAKACEMNGGTTKTLLYGGSAGSLLSGQVTYHFMSTGQHDVVQGCILLYAGAVHWTYQGPLKHMHKSWDENGRNKVPLFGLEEASSLWSGLGMRPEDPRHFIIMANDLSNFPPCYLMSAEKCCFRDDGKMLEHRLIEAGVECKYDFYPGLPHWFHAFPQISVAHEMMTRTVDGARFLLKQQ